MNQTEVTAATLEEAIAKAAEELGVPKDRINAEVIKTRSGRRSPSARRSSRRRKSARSHS